MVSGRIGATRVRLLQTRLPCGSPALLRVNQATPMHSPDHSTKGTPSALGGTLPQWPLTAGEYVVSGSVSSPSRGAFHLSLTVLVHYRSLTVFSLGEWSPLLPTRLHVSRGTQDASRPAPPDGYGIVTLSDRSFQSVPLGRVSFLLVLQPRHLRGGGLFACMQLPLNVSPVSASFLSRQHQGIHLVLCLACSQNDDHASLDAWIDLLCFTLAALLRSAKLK